MRKGPHTRHRAFTGKRKGKRIRRKGLTRKQRALRRGTHVNDMARADSGVKSGQRARAMISAKPLNQARAATLVKSAIVVRAKNGAESEIKSEPVSQ